jgi:hypothetical protein
MFWAKGRLVCRSAGQNSLEHSFLYHPPLSISTQSQSRHSLILFIKSSYTLQTPAS